MAKTLIEVRQQIEELKAIEERLRREEAQGVILRIREAISAYGLTPADLFGVQSPAPSRKSKPEKPKEMGAKVKYSDGKGNTWSGRGRRPQWFAAAIESGESIEQFEMASERKSGMSEVPAKALPKAKRVAKRELPIKYRDGENTWSGRGSQPRWLKAGLAEGKRLEDFVV